VAVSREERMADLMPRLQSEFGPDRAEQARDVLTLAEMAWHDCYGESSLPAAVTDDIFVVAQGDLGQLVRAALLAIIDFRDLRVAADAAR
jgi:hypothetical protein